MAAHLHTDEEIQRDVLEELKWDARVRPTEIGVAVKDGIVTLTGWVDSYLKKLAAEDAAHRVHGVNAVVNDLEVHLPERDDLQETAEHPLLEDEAQFAAVPEEEKRQLREAQQKAKEYLDLDLLLENAGKLRELSAAYEPGASRDVRYRSDWAAQPTLAGPR